MCGVNGIFAYHPSAPPPNRQELAATSAHMQMRGPDGDGTYFDAAGRLALAHRRLKIIDLSDAAAQPMVSQCGRYVLCYNGEIYNYRELRQHLVDAGVTLRTSSDSEVLLELIALEGTAALARLRGMYAVAIWDQQSQRLLLARDPLGIKPLYYSDDGWTCRFASQVRALCAGGGVSDERDSAALAGFLLTGSVPDPLTLWRDIRAVPAGHFVWCTALGVQPPQPSPACPVQDWPDSARYETPQRLQQILQDSVAAHLTADVPVAVFLSAGIDSTVLAALARQQIAGELTTVTVSFDEYRRRPDDEAPLAAEVAHSLGTRHIDYRYTREAFEDDLPAILAAMDQPTIDGVNSWIVAKACAEHGIKCALSGLGADELFGGYPSFQSVPAWQRKARWLAWVPGLGRAARALTRRWIGATGLSPKTSGLLEYGGTLPGAYLLKRGLFMPWELPALMGHDQARDGLARLDLLQSLRDSVADVNGSAHATVAALEQRWYLRNQLLRDADWAGMAHSVEIRVPYVDVVLYHYLRSAQFGKADLLAVARQALPDTLAERPKTGFTTPLGDWRGITGPAWARGWAQELVCRF